MLPEDYIISWKKEAPWRLDSQVEQDLILSRLLVELFSNEIISKRLIFRGGTALYKLYYKKSVRYSEDIDFVQKEAGPIGEVMGQIRKICNPILGEPNWKQTKNRVTFYYKSRSEIPPAVPLKFKIEINTREHFTVFGDNRKKFSVDSRWFRGESTIVTYSLEELLGTKMRALYQRKKGRDLFDIWYGLKYGKAEIEKIVETFRKYLKSPAVSKKEYFNNLNEKISEPGFRKDTDLLLNPGIDYSPDTGYELFAEKLDGFNNKFKLNQN